MDLGAEEDETDEQNKQGGDFGDVNSHSSKVAGGEFISHGDNTEPPPDLRPDHSRCILHFDIDCFYAQVRKRHGFSINVACYTERSWLKAYRVQHNGLQLCLKSALVRITNSTSIAISTATIFTLGSHAVL